MRRLYAVFALAVGALYAAASWQGWGFADSRRGIIPASVRQSPGGYRSYNYWRGGK